MLSIVTDVESGVYPRHTYIRDVSGVVNDLVVTTEVDFYSQTHRDREEDKENK